MNENEKIILELIQFWKIKSFKKYKNHIALNAQEYDESPTKLITIKFNNPSEINFIDAEKSLSIKDFTDFENYHFLGNNSYNKYDGLSIYLTKSMSSIPDILKIKFTSLTIEISKK